MPALVPPVHPVRASGLLVIFCPCQAGAGTVISSSNTVNCTDQLTKSIPFSHYSSELFSASSYGSTSGYTHISSASITMPNSSSQHRWPLPWHPHLPHWPTGASSSTIGPSSSDRLCFPRHTRIYFIQHTHVQPRRPNQRPIVSRSRRRRSTADPRPIRLLQLF